MPFRLTVRATRDLQTIWLHVAQDNDAAADRLIRLVHSALSHPEIADAALLVACACGTTRSLQPLDAVPGVRPDVTVRLLVGGDDEVTPPDHSRRYAAALRARGVDAQMTVLPGLGHDITFTGPVFGEAARLVRPFRQAEGR